MCSNPEVLVAAAQQLSSGSCSSNSNREEAGDGGSGRLFWDPGTHDTAPAVPRDTSAVPWDHVGPIGKVRSQFFSCLIALFMAPIFSVLLQLVLKLATFLGPWDTWGNPGRYLGKAVRTELDPGRREKLLSFPPGVVARSASTQVFPSIGSQMGSYASTYYILCCLEFQNLLLL